MNRLRRVEDIAKLEQCLPGSDYTSHPTCTRQVGCGRYNSLPPAGPVHGDTTSRSRTRFSARSYEDMRRRENGSLLNDTQGELLLGTLMLHFLFYTHHNSGYGYFDATSNEG